MIKLLIADDEKIIRETISQLIDWEKLGIRLIGTAADGLEALNIIMDESPEIVMTDIRMPGLSGLDLIRQISALNQDTAFIILSGYSEFEYAKEAMKCGVRHYLLKPCDENQITEAVLSVRETILQNQLIFHNSPLSFPLNQGTLFHIVADAISSQNDGYDEIINRYAHALSFSYTQYTLHYVYYLEQIFLNIALEKISQFMEKYQKCFPCFYIYVENTLLIFYPASLANPDEIEAYLDSLSFSGSTVDCLCKAQSFDSLRELLNIILPKIIHYETIYIELFGSMLPLSNRDSVIKKVDILTAHLLKHPYASNAALQQLKQLINSIHNLSLIQQIGSIIFSRILSVKNNYIVPENNAFFPALYQCKTVKEGTELLNKQLRIVFLATPSSGSAAEMYISQKIKDYISDHIQDPNLSLKWISEQILFMNSDYVSKCFIKETGERFSQYLTRMRIEYAKKLLDFQQELNVQEVAKKIGCGNNPLYFSQLFKKHTGISPSTYFKKTSAS